MPLTFYAAFVGAVGSIVSHSFIATAVQGPNRPGTLSEIAAAERRLLSRFRWTALSCSTLLAVTVYFYIAPRNNLGLAQSLAWSLEYIGGILMATFPAAGKSFRFHNFCAQSMAVGMLLLACLFVPVLHGPYFVLELVCAVAMTLFGLATVIDRNRFIIHELAFIFISHLTICIAALGLR